MDIYRIDIKKGQLELPIVYQLLKWIVAAYILASSVFLLYTFYRIMLQNERTNREVIFFGLNLILVLFLSRQFLKLGNKKYLVISDNCIKYSLHFPWPTKIKWDKVKQIRIGYSSVNFLTTSGNKHRFALSRVNLDEIAKLEKALDDIAGKYKITILRPFE